MVSLVAETYYLDDWSLIRDCYTKFIANHEEEMEILEHWIEKKPHLPKLPRTSLALLLTFSKRSLEEAKELIESYFTHRTKHPDLFTNRNFKHMEQMLDLGEVAAPEPWETSLDGNRLTFVRIVDTDPDKLDFHVLMQAALSGFDFEFARVGTYIKGIIGIFDMSGFHLGYIPKINLSDAARTIKYLQLYEQRVIGLHVINCNGLISQIMNLIRPFLSRELSMKLHFYTPNQMEEFFKLIPREYVPSTYGGKLESMTELNARFRKRFRTAENWLKQTEGEEWQVKEYLRRIPNGEEEMKGSFRKLCID